MTIDPTGTRGQDHERLLELILRLSSRIDSHTVLADILFAVTGFLRAEGGVLVLAEQRGVSVGSSMGVTQEVDRAVLAAFGAHLEEDGRGGRSVADSAGGGGSDRLAAGVREGVLGAGHPGCQALPLRTTRGAAIGLVALFSPAFDGATGEDLPHAGVMGPLIAQLVATASALRRVREQAAQYRSLSRKLHLLSDACLVLSGSSNNDALLMKAVSLATTWVADGCAIDLLDGEGAVTSSRSGCRDRHGECDGTCSVPSPEVRQRLLSRAVRDRSPLLLAPAHPAQLGIARPGNIDSAAILFLPLTRGSELIGGMTLHRMPAVQQEKNKEEEEFLMLGSEIARHTAMAVATEQRERADDPGSERSASRNPGAALTAF